MFAQSIYPSDRDERIAAVRHEVAEAERLTALDTERARHLADRACNEAEEIGDRILVAEALRVRAGARHHSGLLEGALQDAGQALAIFSVIHEKKGQAESLRLLGTIETQLGNFHDATLYFEEGRELAMSGQYEELLARFNYSLAVAHYRLLQPHEALAPAREFLKASEELPIEDQILSRTLLANLCFLISEQQLKRGKREESKGSIQEALNFAQEAVKLSRIGGSPHAHIEAWGTLAKSQALLGEFKAAAASLESLASAIGSADATLIRARGDMYRADTQAALGETIEAIQLGMASLATFKRTGSTVEVCETLGRLAEFCERVGDIRAAFDYYKRFRDLDDELRTRAAERRSQILGRKLELEKARHEAELLKLRHEILSQQNQTLQKMADKHLEDALHDQLTGLPNRRAFNQMVEEIESGSVWAGLPVSVAVCDIDHFKLVNDRYGHGIGDEVLKRFASILERTVREGDFVARIGGEEFVILMRGARGSSAIGACERIRIIVESEDWTTIQPELNLTTCIGVAWADQVGQVEELMEKADQCLYDAKRSGRNRVCFTGQPTTR